jgi:hypothetical protein
MKNYTLQILFIIGLLLGVQEMRSQQIDFTVRFDPPTCTYQVYATPDFTDNNFFIAGGTQLTVVVPASVDNSTILVTSENGGPWGDSSQVYAPGASSANDFHAVSTNGSLINFTAGNEILLFTFTLPNSLCCAVGIRLFNNTSDPQSNETGMAGGDFNNYFADAFTFVDHYDENYNNAGTICDPCLITPVPVPTTGDTTQDFCLINAPTLASIQINETNIHWYAAASGGAILPASTPLVNGTTYYAAQFQVTPACESLTRLPITVTVGNAATPTTTDNTQDFCLINAPTVGSIQVNQAGVVWYNAATGGSIVPNGTALVSGTTYYASLTDPVTSCPSAVRLAVTVTVNNAATPTTTDTTQDFCLINGPTVANIQVNEGSVTWYNAATAGTVIPNNTALVSGSTYYGSITTGGCASAVRLAVTVTVNDAATPTTDDTTQAFCVIDNPTVASIQVNEGSVVWYNAATGGSIVANGTALVNGTTYYGSITSGGCASSVRLAVTVSVTDASTPTTTDNTQDFCLVNNPTVGDIAVDQGGVVWYNAASGGTVVPNNTALVSGTTYYGAIQNGSCLSSSRLAVTVTVNNAATPTTTDATQDFCLIDHPTFASIQVNQAGVVWYTAATGGSIIPNGTALTDGIYYGSLTAAGSGCISAVRLAVTVTVDDAPTPTTGDTTQDFCLVNNPRVSNIQVNEGGVTWYTAMTGGTVVPNTTALANGTTYYASLTDAVTNCQSSVRLAVTVSVNDAPTPTGDTTQEFCSYAAPTLASIQLDQGAIAWYAAATGGSALASSTLLVNNTTYYASLTSGSCISSTRLPVTVTLNTLCDVTLNLKVLLQGAMFGVSDGLMRDDLRVAGLIPLTQPYTAAANTRFTQVSGNPAETTNSTVLNANAGTGNAIVDWVFIEIRNATTPTTVLKTVSALVQRDGDVVAANGGPLVVSNLPGSFKISIKHRNHFGAMGANTVTVSNANATLDFTTLTGTALYSLPGNTSNVSMASVDGGLRALYAGNANLDAKTKYDGVTNDRQMIGSQVLSYPGNSGLVLNFSNAIGYFSGDINMDGKALYDGANNDRQLILSIVINHPLNTSDLNNFNDMIEQIPQ